MNNKKEITFYQKLAKSSFIGTSQTIIIFILTHPLDLLKTQQQANLKRLNSFYLIKNIYLNDGFFGFYRAGLPNYARSLCKEAYRSPLRGFFNKTYADNLPVSVQSKYPDIKNVLTGLTMSLTDTLISCPLERIKVWFMTNKGKRNLFYSFYNSKSNSFELIKDLFRGLKVSFYRSTISWVSFLVIEERIRKQIINETSNQQNVKLSQQFWIGTLSGIINSLITLPFDTAKTQIQKSGNIHNESLLKTIKKIKISKGIIGLYSGWQFRIPHYIIVAIITSSNIQKIDKIWKS